MAEMSLGDFFSQKKKPKKMGSNLNNQTAAKAEAKKTKKDDQEDGWEEQEATAASLKVEIAGKLTRDEDKKEEEGGTKAAWGNAKVKANADLNERKFPSLAKSVQSSNISLHEEKKLNIETSKNLFSALEGDEDDDEDGPKKPSHIKPAMVTKKKGEFEKDAIQREVEKYKGPSAEKKGTKKKAKDEDDEDDDDEEEEEQVEVKKKTKTKKLVQEEKPVEEEEEELAEDVKIVPDLVAAKAKYEGRRKLEVVSLSRRELEEEKENRPAPAKSAAGMSGAGKKGKKKGGYVDEEELYSKKKHILEDPDADF